MHAEDAYIFRHALLREAAYQLQLPGDRRAMHRLAFGVIERLFGGPPPDGHGRDDLAGRPYRPHPADAFADRRVGNRPSEGITLGNIGLHQLEAGRVEEARETIEQAIAIHREVNNRRSEGVLLGNLGVLHLEAGRVDLAERCGREALAIHRATGNRRFEGIQLGELGEMCRGLGRLEEAFAFYDGALAIHRDLSNALAEAVHGLGRALLLLATGKAAEAEAEWRRYAGLLPAGASNRQVDSLRAEMRKACARAGVPPFDA